MYVHSYMHLSWHSQSGGQTEMCWTLSDKPFFRPFCCSSVSRFQIVRKQVVQVTPGPCSWLTMLSMWHRRECTHCRCMVYAGDYDWANAHCLCPVIYFLWIVFFVGGTFHDPEIVKSGALCGDLIFKKSWNGCGCLFLSVIATSMSWKLHFASLYLLNQFKICIFKFIF